MIYIKIWFEAVKNRPLVEIAHIDINKCSIKNEPAFLWSICGCILGKPLEAWLTGKEIKTALEKIDEWPVNQYISKKAKYYLPRTHISFPETARESINYVAPDDDINYPILGMLILEKYGTNYNPELFINLLH